MKMRMKHASSPSPHPRHERIRQQLAELDRLRAEREARPVEEVLAEVQNWLPADCWPEAEEAIRSSREEGVEPPPDFLQIFERARQEQGIEAARQNEHEILKRVRRGD